MTPRNTIEERLRDTFTEVADSTRLSPDAWARVNERTRRRRLPRPLLAVAAALGTILGVTATVALVARNDGGPRMAAGGDLAASCGSRRSDVDVIVDPKASAGQRDAIRRTLENNSEVAKFSFQSKNESVRIFRCLFADDPEAVATADLTRVPPMFLVTLEAGAEHSRLVRRLETLPGVFDTGPRCSRRLDVEVFFAPTATPEAISAVRGTLDGLPGLTRTVFVSKEAAYQEFACLFADRPALLKATSPEALPASVRLAVRLGADRSAIVEQLRAHPDVESVIDTRFPTPLPASEPDDFGSAPEGFTQIGVGYADAGPWRLSLRTGGSGQFSAVAQYFGNEVRIQGVDDETGGIVATGGDPPLTVGALRSDVARVRAEVIGQTSIEVDTFPAPEVGARFFVASLPVGPGTLVALDSDGRELYQLAIGTGP